uniref:TNF receptor-associated factor 6-like n=2 Tax=Hirondellea gigas TaxID=1518452 RepID=A0A6A7G6C5_9CRUS
MFSGIEEDEESTVFLSRQGGFDYEFVLPLDSKYECGICLLVMRSPHQTVCGHRFCRDCIFSCINSRSTCPIDNQFLSVHDVFPDACIEREVLELLVLCPGHSHGCKRRVTLRNLQPHIQACNYQVVLCPNQCASTVLCGELQQHLMETCALRPTKCQLCSAMYTLDKEQLHRAVCGDVKVNCESCGEMVRRSQHTTHLTTQCPEAVISCHYAELGCSKKLKRSCMEEHMNQDTQLHMQLMSSEYKKIKTFFSDLNRTVGLIHGSSFSRQPSLRSQLSASSPIPEEHIPDFNNSPIVPVPYHDRYKDGGAVNVRPLVGEDYNYCAAEGATAVAVSDQGDDCQYKNDPHSRLDIRKREGIAAEAQNYQQMLSNLNADAFNFSSNKLSSNERILREVSDKTVDLGQRLLEMSIVTDNLAKQVDDLKVTLNEELCNFSARSCNGDFIWKVGNFSALCTNIKSQKVSHYSPAFYTSQYGYRCCLRLDVKWRDSQYFLSLYMLLMKGDNDDILDWPFQGRITLGVLDFSNSCPKKHLVDTVDSNPQLQAFQRPTGPRNDKSFGFTKFHPLDALHNTADEGAEYVRGDVLFVRARVQPTSNFGDNAPISLEDDNNNSSVESFTAN